MEEVAWGRGGGVAEVVVGAAGVSKKDGGCKFGKGLKEEGGVGGADKGIGEYNC